MIKNIKGLAAILLLTLTMTSIAYAQSDSLFLSNRIRLLQQYEAHFPVEKVHLHLDRQWYGLGDTIWFKAYTVVGEHHQLSAVSNVLYVELIGNTDSVIKRLTLHLDAGTGSGEFALPYTYKPGAYHIRAYTNWMRNSHPAYFFDQRVKVGGIDPQNNPVGAAGLKKTLPTSGLVQQKSADPDVQFFPEGGYLVTGLRSKVAVKAVDKDGRAASVTGIITDDHGIEVAEFATRHHGMTSFALTPVAGMHYKARIVCADGSSYTLNLPEVKPEGFTLTLNNSYTDTLYLKTATNDQLFQKDPNAAFYVIGQSAGKVYYTAAGRLQNHVFTSAISKHRFPTGIARFTLFAQNGEPLNERIVFIENADQLKLLLTAEKESYAPGEKVKITMEAKADTAGVAAGTFSVAVTDETKVPIDEPAETTILTDLLLTSELKGNIAQPNYYFTNRTEETNADLDLLMLTQGYRSFEWKKILIGDNPAITYQPETALTLSGTVKMPSGKPVANGRVRLSSVKDLFVADTLTDLNGNFTFNNVDLHDSTKVVINAKKATGGNNVNIYIKEPSYAPVDKTENVPDRSAVLPTPVKDAMQQTYFTGQDRVKRYNASKAINLKQVNIRSKRNDYFNPVYSDNMKLSANLNGPGNANQVLLGDKLIGCPILSDCLAGKLFGVTFKNGLPYSQRAMSRHLSGARPMAVFINGSQTGAANLNNINTDDVYSIEVLTSISYLSIYGSNAPNGALIITLKRGADHSHDAEYNTVDGLITYVFKGYYKARSFYSPKYEAKNPGITDDRKTIYWNPDIITDKKGKATFEFYNADSPGTYRVVLEGIDDNGNLGRRVFRYNVE